jgi:hypothetical protein
MIEWIVFSILVSGYDLFSVNNVVQCNPCNSSIKIIIIKLNNSKFQYQC